MARRRKSTKSTGRYSALDRSYPSAGAALSYAQGVADRVWTEPNVCFVTDISGETLYKVVREEDGRVFTYTIQEV